MAHTNIHTYIHELADKEALSWIHVCTYHTSSWHTYMHAHNVSISVCMHAHIQLCVRHVCLDVLTKVHTLCICTLFVHIQMALGSTYGWRRVHTVCSHIYIHTYTHIYRWLWEAHMVDSAYTQFAHIYTYIHTRIYTDGSGKQIWLTARTHCFLTYMHTYIHTYRWLWEADMIDSRSEDNWPALGVRVGTPLNFVITSRWDIIPILFIHAHIYTYIEREREREGTIGLHLGCVLAQPWILSLRQGEPLHMYAHI